MRNKAHDFPGPQKIAFPRARTTALRPNGTINVDPQERLKENRWVKQRNKITFLVILFLCVIINKTFCFWPGIYSDYIVRQRTLIIRCVK